MHFVTDHETYKIASKTITQAFWRIFDILVIMGKVVCQVVFLVINIDNYDILLGLKFLMKIGMEKGAIQIYNRLGI
jgi:hypothetical protein